MVEHAAENRGVTSSILVLGTRRFERSFPGALFFPFKEGQISPRAVRGRDPEF